MFRDLKSLWSDLDSQEAGELHSPSSVLEVVPRGLVHEVLKTAADAWKLPLTIWGLTSPEGGCPSVGVVPCPEVLAGFPARRQGGGTGRWAAGPAAQAGEGAALLR